MIVLVRLSVLLAALMAVQALLGRIFPEAYVDSDWIRATWIGNDWITLLIACPLLLGSALAARRGSPRAVLLWLGMLAFAVYNYGFYLFGAALNAFFPLYCLLTVLAGATLILALAQTDARALAESFSPALPARLIGGWLAVAAAGLTLVWFGIWAAYVFAGRPTPVETGAFQVVAALDLVLMVPALAVGGLLLWRRADWGFVIAAVASIQAALYLFLLAVNAVILMNLGFADPPGELPIWAGLSLATGAAALLLLKHARPE